MPDLAVAYISFSPRYPAYSVTDRDGFPAATAPGSNVPLTEEELDRIQRRPRPGEEVMVTGRIVNHGDAPSGPFRYTWAVDGKSIAQGRHEGLAAGCRAEGSGDWKLGALPLRESTLRPGTFVDLPLPLKWQNRGRRLRLTVRPDVPGVVERKPESPTDGGAAPVRDNNVLEERTDGLGFLVTTTAAGYNRRAARGTGFEDWIQGQFDLMRARFQGSTYAQAPQGVEQPLRIDMIRIVDDPAGLDEAAAPAGWDGILSYPSNRDTFADAARPADELDPAILRSVLGQLGIVDLRSLAVLPENAPVGELVGYVHPAIPSGAGAPLGEHTVLALNRMLGRRRGFRGTYLFDLPRNPRLRVLDNDGRALPDAEIMVFRKEGAGIVPEPLAEGRTNANGEFPLPNRPAPPLTTADGFTLRENPFGALRASGENGLLLVRVRARNQTEHLWMPVTAFNLAAWHGQARTATFDLRTRIPAPSAPDPPAGLKASSAPGGLLLQWQPPEKADGGGYVIYRGSYPTYAWERIGAVTYLRQDFLDTAPAADRPVRYAVTTLSLSGDESGQAAITVAAR